MSLMSDLLFDRSFSVNRRQDSRYRLELLNKKDRSMSSLEVDHTEAGFSENNNAGSFSDSNSVDGSPDYYEPISPVDLDNRNDVENSYLPIGGHGFSNGLSNGHCMIPEAEEGISIISINGDAELVNESEEDTETETESEIRRAFEEDERRRRSPLMEENATRVMEAMRAISFPGTAPDWASDVNEDRWIDQLRRLRSTSQKTIFK